MEEAQRKEQIQFYKDAFASAIDSAAYNDIDEIWQEFNKLDPDNVDQYLKMAAELAGKRRQEQAARLLLTQARVYAENGNIEARKAVLEEASRLNPKDEDLKQEIADFYREYRKDHPLVEEAIRKSGILRPMSLSETLPRLELFLRFKEGDLVNHPTGWGKGRISSFDLEEGMLSVDFATKKGHSVSFEMASRILQRLDPEGFQAQKFVNIDNLRAMAESDPASLLKLLVRDNDGKISVKEAKTQITDGVVPSSDWTRWWATAKKQAMKDSYLNLTGGATGVIELRETPLSHEEEIIDRLQRTKTLERKVSMVDEYISNLKAEERSVEVMTKIANNLLNHIAESSDAAERVQVAAMIDELMSVCPDLNVAQPDIRDIFTPQTAADIVDEISKPTHKRRALLKLKDLYPEEWSDVYAGLFFDGSSDLWDFAAKEMFDDKKHREVAEVFSRIMAMHKEYTEVYLWLCRSALMGRYATVLNEHSKVDLIERLLNLMHLLTRSEPSEKKDAAADRKKLLTKARDSISVSDYKHLQKIIEDSSPDEARRIYNAAASSHGLTDAAQEKIFDMVIAEHPDVMPKSPVMAETEEDVIYSTEEGMRRKQTEFQRVLNEEIPENQEALRIAISFGDLSENAEYTAAREQQSILMKKAERIEKELSITKIMDSEAVRDDTVMMGTSIEVKKLRTNKIERYTILGPWDAAAEKGIVSYLAPLAAAFLGKKVGDHAVMEFIDSKDEYEIIAIKKAI